MDVIHPLVRDGVGQFGRARDRSAIDTVLQRLARHAGRHRAGRDLVRPAVDPPVLQARAHDVAIGGAVHVVPHVLLAPPHHLARALHPPPHPPRDLAPIGIPPTPHRAPPPVLVHPPALPPPPA